MPAIQCEAVYRTNHVHGELSTNRPADYTFQYITNLCLKTETVREKVSGLFVPLHFRSRERKVHRENFRSRGTLVPWNIRSRGAKSPRTFISCNFRTPGTFAPQERMLQELSLHGTFAPVELSLYKQLSCPLTFAPVELSLPYFKKLWTAGKRCVVLFVLRYAKYCFRSINDTINQNYHDDDTIQ